jgi:tRNA uracil 4-sulfurtransferase
MIYKPDTLILHYGEIALKSGNRLFFEKKLLANARRLLEPCGIIGLVDVRGRLRGRISEGADMEAVKKAMPFLFGAVYALPSARVEPSYAAIEEAAAAALLAAKPGTFKVDVQRTDKRFPMNSMEMNAKIGETLIARTGRKVSVRAPEVTVGVELLEKDAYVHAERLEGPGGLPAGSQSPIMVMLSGGIDSPVAALRLMRRGATVEGAHFHSYPITSRASLEKVKDLAAQISKGQGGMKAFFIPFADIQKACVKSAPAELRVILYRRSMFRIAQALATEAGIQALATGESLGQVASQTIENIAAVSQAVSLPILRPLIGMNKEEIMAEARIYGTFDISIRPHEDCCTLFLPEHPETRARIAQVVEAESKIEGLAELEKDALDKREIHLV